MELIPKGTPDYFEVKKQYDIVIKNITHDESYSKFIGGLPITLERKDLYTVMSKDLNNNYRYSITQKVDGTRVLLFIYNSQILDVKTKKIAFVDRNNDFYILKNSSTTLKLIENAQMPKLPTLLIDGELVAFNSNNQTVPITDTKNIKTFSFMAFDILYGPLSIEYKGPPGYEKLQIEGEYAMAGPMGGKKWPYVRRYNILNMLLLPHQMNDGRPPLTLQLVNNNWFVIEIKPVYPINSLQTPKELYSTSPKGFFQIELFEFRKYYYTTINDIRTANGGNKVEMSQIKLDGLIFTPFDTEYIIGGPWNKYLNFQFKWKPVEEQSIDFSIFRDESNKIILKIKKSTPAVISNITSNDIISNGAIGKFTFDYNSQKFKFINIGNYTISKLSEVKKNIQESSTNELYLSMYYNSYNNLTLQAMDDSKLTDVYTDLSTFTVYKGENATVSENTKKLINNKKIKNGTIGEFTFNTKERKFELLKLRPDKTTPNALSTVLNVLNAIKYPVNINNLKEILKIDSVKTKTETLRKLMSNLSKNQLLRCSIDLNVMPLIATPIKEQIMKNIDIFKSDNSYEFEIRLGKIKPSRFESNIQFIVYKQIIDILSMNKISFNYNVYHDYFKDSTRSRYIYVDQIKEFKYIGSIEKERVENINIDTNYIYNIDMRFSLSNETPSLLKVDYDMADFKQEKKRFSFDFGIIRLDCTEKNFFNKDNSVSTPNYQIEFEIVDRNLNKEDIYIKTIELITNILSKTNL